MFLNLTTYVLNQFGRYQILKILHKKYTVRYNVFFSEPEPWGVTAVNPQKQGMEVRKRRKSHRNKKNRKEMNRINSNKTNKISKMKNRKLIILSCILLGYHLISER